MHKKIMFPNPDMKFDNYVVVHPVYGGEKQVLLGLSDDDFCQWVINNDASITDRLNCVTIEEEDWPIDHTFVDAWEPADGQVIVNMGKARRVYLDRDIRPVRNAELAAKDITFMRAVEAGDTDAQAAIATEKQALRDIPQTFNLTARTPSQLKSLWPPELPPRTS